MSGHHGGLAPPHPETRVGAIDVLALPRVGPPAAVWPDLRWRNRATYDRIASGSTEFLSRDPLASLTRSPYGYVADNPLNGTDTSGLVPETIMNNGEPYGGWGDVSGGGPITENEMWQAIADYLGPNYYTVQGSPGNLLFRSADTPNLQARFDFNENEFHLEEQGPGGKGILENSHVPVIPNEATPSPSPGCFGSGDGGYGLESCAGPFLPEPNPLPFPEPVPFPEFVPVPIAFWSGGDQCSSFI